MSQNPLQLSFLEDTQNPKEPPKQNNTKQPKKLKISSKNLTVQSKESEKTREGIPPLTLPTRWENLQPKLEEKDYTVSLRTIIRPIPQAMNVIGNIVEYLRTTNGCQVLIIRADSGCGKTTFLNTLPHYMSDVEFFKQTIDLQNITEEEFSSELWKLETQFDKVNLIILEGREKPESISDRYIQVVLSNINRFGRSKRSIMLFVIPTIEEQVARMWCDHGVKIGDLIPEQKLYEGSRWYNFPGVPKDKYIEVVSETVRTLNPPYTISDFGVSPDEIKTWVNTSPTIGRYIETIASKISERRSAAKIDAQSFTSGRREHVWVVFCSPDLRHFDHTYLLVDGLCHDESLKVSPTKLIPQTSDTSTAKDWRSPSRWSKLIATVNFLDVRLINFPIITAVTAALTYGDDELIESFKQTKFSKYRSKMEKELQVPSGFDWDKPLAERRQQVQNARSSLEGTNLFNLLLGIPAEKTKGKPEANAYAQYLHLRDIASESDIHYYIGCCLRDLLKYRQFPKLMEEGVETEEPLILGQTDPVPDVTIHTETDIYALEFHFTRPQITSSEMARYATENVISKYMKSLPYLKSVLDTIQ